MSDETQNLAKLDIEVCRSTTPNVALRAASFDGDKTPVMEGHFATFNEWYEIKSMFEGHFLERIKPGAFKRTFNAAKRSKDPHRISVLLEHGFDPTVGDKPLGRATTLEEDSEGPRYEVELFDTSYNRDLLPALDADAYRSSFRFRVISDEWDHEPDNSSSNPDGLPERTIKEVRVLEFGPTVFPANPSATAGLRSVTDEYYEKLRQHQPDVFDNAVARAAENRGLSDPKMLLSPEDDNELTEEEEETTDTQEDSLVEHSSDSSRSESADSTEDTPETRDDSTPEGESETDEETISRKEQKKMDIDQMTVPQRQERVREIDARLQEIDTQYNGAALDDEARDEWDKLFEERATHLTAIEDAEARRERLEELGIEGDGSPESKPRATERVPAKRKKKEGPYIKRTRVDDIYDLTEYRRLAGSVDELGSLYKDGARRAIENANIASVDVDADKCRERAEALLHKVDDEKGTLALRILKTGSPLYERAFGKAAIALSTGGLTTEEQRVLALGSDSTGAAAVPFQLDPTILLTSNGQINPLRSGMARVEQIVGKEWQGVTSAGITVSRSPEGQENTDDAPELGQPTVKSQRVQGFVPFSVEIEQTWGQLRSEMLTLLADAKEEEEAASFINGDGTGVSPEGLLTGATTVIQSTAGGGFTSADIYAVKNALGPRFRGPGQFLAETSIYDEVRQFDTMGGADLWVQLAADRPAQLIGYPAREISTMASEVTTGNKIVVFGDFRQFLIVDRVGMAVELVPHLFGTTGNFPTGQRGLLAIWHNNCKVLVSNAFRVLQVSS